MSQIVILAPNANAVRHARRIAADLARLGFTVDGSDGRVTGADVDQAEKVVLVWTGGPGRTPALRAAARRARARGKLVAVQADATRPPREAGRPVSLPRGRRTVRAWKKLLSSPPAPAPLAPAATAKGSMRPIRLRARARSAAGQTIAGAQAAARTTRPARPLSPQPQPAAPKRAAATALLGSLTAIALLVLAATTEAYVREPGFATRVDALARDTQAAVLGALRGS